jgi:small subunit ribosomal protein S16
MAVRIRLKRMGKKKQPTYRVVVADARAPRDGRIIELIGRYDPRHSPSIIEVDNERAQYWLGNGAQPTDRVRKLLEISGAVRRPKVSRSGVYRLDDDPIAVPGVSTGEDAAEAGRPEAEESPVHAGAGSSDSQP